MNTQSYYEYDRKRQVLICISPNESPRILKREDPSWRPLGPQDDSYTRAIFLGQRCWDDLTRLSLQEGEKILASWQKHPEI